MIQKCKECPFYAHQEDVHGDTVVEFCSHKDNKCQYEGNCTEKDCPLIIKPFKAGDTIYYWNRETEVIRERTVLATIPNGIMVKGTLVDENLYFHSDFFARTSEGVKQKVLEDMERIKTKLNNI